MYDEGKVKIVRYAILGIISLICLVVGVAIGMWLGGNSSSQTTTTELTKVEEKATLDSERVKEFLLNYYTKKDVGENRERYQEFMTTQLYKQEVALEEQPIRQAYKGYVLNQVYDTSAVYIDKENLTAIAEVKYNNVQTVKRYNAEAGVKFTEKATVKLYYVEEKGRFLVNRIESIQLDKTVNEKVTAPEVSTQESTAQEVTTVTTQQPVETTAETTTVKIRSSLW